MTRQIIDGVESPQAEPIKYAQIVHDAAPYLYVCEAAMGAIATDAIWRIKRLEDTGGVLTTKWANGNSDFTNIANNRVSLTYI